MAIDVHAHYIPPRVLRELERDPAAYGIGVERQPEGGVRLLCPGQGYTRRVLPALLDLEGRLYLVALVGAERVVLGSDAPFESNAVTLFGLEWGQALTS